MGDRYKPGNSSGEATDGSASGTTIFTVSKFHCCWFPGYSTGVKTSSALWSEPDDGVRAGAVGSSNESTADVAASLGSKLWIILMGLLFGLESSSDESGNFILHSISTDHVQAFRSHR